METINFTGATVAGTFTLIYGSQTTTAITYSSTTATLQANVLSALNGLTAINTANGFGTSSANVAVGGTATALTVTFQNALGGSSQTLAANSAGLTSGAITIANVAGAPNPANFSVSATSPTSFNVTFQGTQGNLNATLLSANGNASNAQQQLYFTGVTGGTFTLGFGGQTTGAIYFSSTASTLSNAIQGALAALNNVGFGNVSVAIGGSPVIATVTFLNGTSGSSPLTITGTAPVNTVQDLSFPANLSGGTFTLAYTSPAGLVFTTTPITYSPTAATLQGNISSSLNAAIGNNAVQNIAFGGTVTGGSFKLVFGTTPQTTGSITYSTSAAALQTNIQNALNALSNVPSNSVLVNAVSATNVNVYFYNGLGGQPDQPVMTATSSPLGHQSDSWRHHNPWQQHTDRFGQCSQRHQRQRDIYRQARRRRGAKPADCQRPHLAITFNAVQNVAFQTGVTGGSFTLTFNGATSSCDSIQLGDRHPAIQHSSRPQHAAWHDFGLREPEPQRLGPGAVADLRQHHLPKYSGGSAAKQHDGQRCQHHRGAAAQFLGRHVGWRQFWPGVRNANSQRHQL